MFRTYTCPSSGVLIYRLFHCRMWCYAIGFVAVVLRSCCVVLCTVCQLVSNTYIKINKIVVVASSWSFILFTNLLCSNNLKSEHQATFTHFCVNRCRNRGLCRTIMTFTEFHYHRRNRPPVFSTVLQAPVSHNTSYSLKKWRIISGNLQTSVTELCSVCLPDFKDAVINMWAKDLHGPRSYSGGYENSHNLTSCLHLKPKPGFLYYTVNSFTVVLGK